MSLVLVLIEEDYKRQQTVNFGNHQFDVQNGLVNLLEDIELISKISEKEKQKKYYTDFTVFYHLNLLINAYHPLFFLYTSLSMVLDELIAGKNEKYYT